MSLPHSGRPDYRCYMASKSPLLLGDLLTKISKYHVDYETKLEADAERIGLEKTLEDPRVKKAGATKCGKRPTRKQKAVERRPGRAPLGSKFATGDGVRDLLRRIIKEKSSVEVLRERYPEVYAIYCEHWGQAFPAEETRFHYREMFDFVVGVISKYPEASCLGENAFDGYALVPLTDALTDSDDTVSTVLEALDRQHVAQHLLGLLWKHFEKEYRQMELPEAELAGAEVGARQTGPRPVEGAAAAPQAERGKPEQAEGKADPPPARHSPDFRSVHWFGNDYSFTATQAACVGVLWREWEDGTPDVGDATLLEAVDSRTGRIVDVFRGNGAWGTMIVPGETKGTRRLSPPKS